MEELNTLDILNQIIDKRMSSQEVYSVIGIVSNVDETARTCDITPIDGAKVTSVKLQASISQSNGFVMIPTDGSYAICTFISNTEGFVSIMSQIDKIVIDTDLVQFNGGSNEGIVNINDLTSKLNSLITEINALKTFINTHIHVAGGRPTTIPTPVFAGNFSNFNKTDYEDDKIIH